MTPHTVGMHTGVTESTKVMVYHPPVQVLIKEQSCDHPAKTWLGGAATAVSAQCVRCERGPWLSVTTQQSPLGTPFISSPGQPHSTKFHLPTTLTKHRQHCREVCGTPAQSSRTVYVCCGISSDMNYNWKTCMPPFFLSLLLWLHVYVTCMYWKIFQPGKTL